MCCRCAFLAAGPHWRVRRPPLPQASQWHHIPAGDQLRRPGPPRTRARGSPRRQGGPWRRRWGRRQQDGTRRRTAWKGDNKKLSLLSTRKTKGLVSLTKESTRRLNSRGLCSAWSNRAETTWSVMQNSPRVSFQGGLSCNVWHTVKYFNFCVLLLFRL